MNIYVVTEGKVEQKVYKCWIPLVNSNLSFVYHISNVMIDNFYLISAGGYPKYFEVISNAIEDVNEIEEFDRLVISIDSEDMTRQEKHQEILDFLSTKYCRVEIKIIIQHFCFETWGLGNRVIIRTNTQSSSLRKYLNIFDVRNNDPEQLPANPAEELNRSQFAERYLRAALNDRFRNLTYTKSNPRALLNRNYYQQVYNRFSQTSHIASFETFLDAFL